MGIFLVVLLAAKTYTDFLGKFLRVSNTFHSNLITNKG